MSIRIFAGYSKRFLTSKLPGFLPHGLNRSVARGIRVLWYMREMGGCWLTEQDLRRIGAGQWKALKYALPDLVKDTLVDEDHLQRRNGRRYSLYKINDSGLRLLQEVDRHVQEEYERAAQRILEFKSKYNIS